MTENSNSRKSPFAWFLRDRHTKTLGAVILLACAVGIWQAVEYIIPERVVVTEVTMDGVREQVVETRASTVEKLLSELGMIPEEQDIVSAPLDRPVVQDLPVTVTRCLPATAVIAGSEKDFTLMPGSVAENLEHNGISYDEDDIVIPALDSAVDGNTKIEVKEVHRDVEEKKEIVEAANRVILDPSMTSGAIEEAEGVDGEGVFTYTTTYINGEKKGTEREFKEWISEPQDHILRFGTSATGDSGETTYSETFVSNATAYYFGNNAHGSTGSRCHYGTCAVDPSVIPYGTRLFVEGYGIAVANDTGGAIRGTRTDLYMRSLKEAKNWGRRNVQVYILD